MKKNLRSQQAKSDGMRPEYRFDYSRAKPNRFAARMRRPVVAVVLDSDVAAVFTSSTKVNAHLRSAIAGRKRGKGTTKARARHRRAS